MNLFSIRFTRIHHPRRAAQQGVSLVEIMVALVAGLILIGGVGQVYLSNKQTYRVQEAQSRLQENARFALEIMSKDIRMAGFMGCISRVPSINNTLNGPPPSFDPGDGIQGWEGNGTGYGTAVPIEINAAPVNVAIGAAVGQWSAAGGNTLDATTAVPNSDIFRIWRGGENPALINNITPGANTVINTTPNADTADGDIVLISDCQNADWVQACNVQAIGGGITIDHTLSSGCTPGNITALPVLTKSGGELVKLVSNIYYVGKRNDAAANEPALFRKPLLGSSASGGQNSAAAGAGEELVEGVENMQILYGEDTDSDGTPNQYVAASAVANWSNVVSMRLSILMRTAENNLTTEAQGYSFNGQSAIAPDRRLRRVFTTTVTLRNRLQ
ncbi:PilW family protein [Methylocaldum sp.]|jgi:type IV pilus assembly protein PilW|uniref:PilW family protein n=1 Tax=unclassified Methylocaldum TaxID=2622260 RepID=UPI0032204CF8